MNDHILYTYQQLPTGLVCHAYGPAPQAQCTATGENLAASAVAAAEAPLSYMVLPLEAMPV